ncbi:glyoxalase [Bacillus thuringiensis]|uniref:Glyoxalase n=1 Tax=Bacillus thuringiensis TaxID=1428 RepID=A0ABD6RUD0_BACTU|nr:glyoxalase [Bacillus thuringiensis]PEU91370.1 glyoxalase [Bacillus thuringiensis]PFI02435.1 glyoxalase [Bacillus thuringiensis]PFW44771.1 glyoxalase [Bacillus thuringiensis]PGY71482.1 glyoxalase [Bacillus thuringiensis]
MEIMKEVIKEYINQLQQSALENRKESDKAYDAGDLGLSGYYRGQWIANEGTAIALETILNQHREKNVGSDLLK